MINEKAALFLKISEKQIVQQSVGQLMLRPNFRRIFLYITNLAIW